MGDVSAEESVEETENERNEPRIYEVGYHLVSNIPEEKLAAEAGVLKDTLAQEHAVVIAEAAPKRRLLAYPIRKSIAGTYQKFDAAYFGWIKFEVGPEEVKRIKIALDRNAHLLRFLLIETVRESTLLASQRIFVRRPDGERRDKKEPVIPGVGTAPVRSPVSEAELDKTIDELVVE